MCSVKMTVFVPVPNKNVIENTRSVVANLIRCRFILGDKARHYSQMTKEERRDKVAQSYSKLFGIKQMAQVVK